MFYQGQSVQIKRWGNSAALRLPKELLKKVAWKSDEIVNINIDSDGRRIIIEPIKSNSEKIEAMFARYNKETIYAEYNWGADVGKEIIE